MTRPPRLSKSRFMSGRQCVLRLWNDCFHRDLATPADAETQARFDVGNEVGELARQRYPGVLVEADHFHPEEALAETARLLADPTVKTIQEAAFEHRGGFARVDILTRRNGAWDVIEVKSVNNIKDKHRVDSAFQGWLVAGAGLRLGSVSVMAMNRDYRYLGGKLDLTGLFRLEDITARATAMVPEIEADVAKFHTLLQQPAAPAILPGAQCGGCPFLAHCTRHWPRVADPVDWIPGFGSTRYLPLHAAGTHSMADLPEVGLKPDQQRVVDCHRNNLPWIGEGLGQAMKSLEPPVHFLDFETFAPAVPKLLGTGPYQKVPVQWSCHTMLEEGRLTHQEFLADSLSDPREALAISLLKALGTDGSICVYSGFEKGVIQDLAEFLPHLAPELRAIIDRLVDLLQVVKDNLYMPAFHGSNSIKDVLPALVPGFDYSQLQVQDGNQAGLAFARMLDEANPVAREAIRNELLTYCGQDTLAMVKIREELMRMERQHPNQ